SLSKDKFTQEEDEYIYKLYLEFGPKWKEIKQKFLPHRSDDFIKNRFYANFKKLSAKTQIKVEEQNSNSDDVEKIDSKNHNEVSVNDSNSSSTLIITNTPPSNLNFTTCSPKVENKTHLNSPYTHNYLADDSYSKVPENNNLGILF